MVNKLADVASIIKIDPNAKIGDMTFAFFEKSMEKQNKFYERNLKVGSRLKPKDQIEIGKNKFAWRSSSDDRDNILDEYHRNVKSFDLAFSQATKCMYRRIKAWWKVNPDELEIVGSSSPLDEKKPKWDGYILEREDIEKIVLEHGQICFHMRYKGEDKEKKGCWQEWTYIHTMEDLDKEENELKNQFQKLAQEEADITGKKAAVTNLVGWRFEAEPRKTIKTNKEKNNEKR